MTSSGKSADQGSEREKPSLRSTLRLPKTAFPMRANLAQNEAATVKRWNAMGLYEQVCTARDGQDPFVFHDGPPFANGNIHIGHLLNKVLKDIVVRSKHMTGRSCRYVPGWDCHGLPIEQKVLQDLIDKGKYDKIAALDDDARRTVIRRACTDYAAKFQKIQRADMERLLTIADYDNPYITMAPDYEGAVLEVFASLVEAGLVHRRLKPVHWSIASETAVAEAELEYVDRTDPSIWVDFEACDRDAVGAAFGVELDETASFMIWTTTPWTLPANLAIAVGDDLEYALVRIDGAVTIVASGRLDAVCAAIGAEAHEVLGTCAGRALVGLKYTHPFCDRTSPVLAGSHVTLEDGTGLVHTAPGHGTEDYVLGVEAGLDVYCPVQPDGTYDDTAPQWLQGFDVWAANSAVVDHLGDSGHLVHHKQYEHSYPFDGRTKTPVIFRATEQWFVDVDATWDGKSMRQRGLDAIDGAIDFVPDWGRNRMRGMVETRPDWCLSRQRAWGLPIPAFQSADGAMLLTAASTRAVSKAFAERGSDAWFSETPEQLLAFWDSQADPDCDTIDPATLTKMYDIFDVWMESGSSWHAVMRQRDLGYPADLYLEGSDQHRGWFQLSMLPALGVTGTPPFKTLLTHGFMVDRDGRKMSKSGGNALDVQDLLKDVGADVCRWWVSSLAYENDIRVDHELIQLAGESYRKVRNTIRFLLSNIGDYTPSEGDLADVPEHSIDAWVLAEAATLRATVLEAWDGYAFRKAHLALFDFCNDTLSARYCVAMKDRLYCDDDSPRRRRAQAVMHALTELLCTLLAPMLPHTADEAWRCLHGDAACVHLHTVRVVPEVACSGAWARAMDVREDALKAMEAAKADGIEKSLDAGLHLPDPDGVLAPLAEDLCDLLEVSRLTIGGDSIVVDDLRDAPMCERSRRRDASVCIRDNGLLLSDRDWAVLQDVEL
ncbi:MAG: isoleucine--tRNA ligase [Phycisphaerales bacterium]|nr:isoleucine--tRNA ligase [Phycisphaerales bacterium]